MSSLAQRYAVLAQPAPALDANFQGNCIVANGSIQCGQKCPTITFTRATAAWYFLNGALTQAASGFARVNSSGLLIEQSSTNEALWSRDLTNAAWIAVNVTVAKTATGIDGAANSASKLTASAGNGTVFQTFVIGSEVQTFSAYVQRVTGSGEIDITLNGGSSYANITSLINSTGYTRVNISGTLANASIGFRIVTNGDAINVDVAQMEDLSWATSPIITTSSTVTRNSDLATIPASKISFSATTGMWVASVSQAVEQTSGSYNPFIAGYTASSSGLGLNANSVNTALASDGTNFNTLSVASASTLTGVAVGSYYISGSVYLALNGVLSGIEPWLNPTAATIGIGSNNNGSNEWCAGSIARLRYFPSGSPQRLQQLTQPGQN